MRDGAFAVTGASFGDEGKGLAVDRLCIDRETVVIRHNGGAQAGHTVECHGKRFVFRQLSSGSFRRADTYLAETFLPDLNKLNEEFRDFRLEAGFAPDVYASADACVTVVDDVLINMALETSRGNDRHGSCGMGINEAVLRRDAGFALTLGKVKGMSCSGLAGELARIRDGYCLKRAESLGLSGIGEYGELLKNPAVLENAAEAMLRGSDLIRIAEDAKAFSANRERVVFEGAQGLLLDSENERFAPHVTASRTGLTNPALLSEKYGFRLGTAIFVMRSYVTRHGAGPLPFECGKEKLGNILPDRTNRTNEWQGGLRYAEYESPEELAGRLLAGLSGCGADAALFVTHLNETDGMIRFASGDLSPEEFARHPAFRGRIKRLYLSRSPFAEEVSETAVL